MVRLTLAGATRHRVLLTRPASAQALERLENFFEVDQCTQNDVATPEALIARLQCKAAAVVGALDRLDAQVIRHLPDLKAVCNVSEAFGNLDVHALTRAGIFAMNTPGGSETVDIAIAESLVAAFGFGRLGLRPPNLLNPDLLCNCC